MPCEATRERTELALTHGERKLLSMRWTAWALALGACARPQVDEAPAPAVTVSAARTTSENTVEGLAGYVTARDAAGLKLDSGGPTPIDLSVGPDAKVLRDGRAATSADLRPGDVVRAAVRAGADGGRVALQIWAHSAPIPALAAAPQPSQAQRPQARRPEPLRR